MKNGSNGGGQHWKKIWQRHFAIVPQNKSISWTLNQTVYRKTLRLSDRACHPAFQSQTAAKWCRTEPGFAGNRKKELKNSSGKELFKGNSFRKRTHPRNQEQNSVQRRIGKFNRSRYENKNSQKFQEPLHGKRLFSCLCREYSIYCREAWRETSNSHRIQANNIGRKATKLRKKCPSMETQILSLLA